MIFQSSSQPVITQTNIKDTGAVSAFLESAVLVHRNLDWRSLLQWIDQEPFLLEFEGSRISALLACAPDPPGVAWIHCFAARDLLSYRKKWNDLLERALTNPILKGCMMSSVGLNEWFNRLLEASHFSMLQKIIVFYWGGEIPELKPISSQVLIRPMEPSDLDQVAVVDHDAFAPIWTISRESFQQVYSQAEHANVAEIDGEVIGYELSTANHFSAHLTRLAVQPQHTQANIGFSLVREMLQYFTKRGIKQVTVNTQSDNTASISLYRKSGFVLSDETFPVYCRQL
jgi:ribosomal-protein-alanine N-acetyltransferase